MILRECRPSVGAGRHVPGGAVQAPNPLPAAGSPAAPARFSTNTNLVSAGIPAAGAHGRSSVAAHALPRASRGGEKQQRAPGTAAGTRPPTSIEFLLQQLKRAQNLSEVLKVVARPGAAATDSFFQVELLCALARCQTQLAGAAAKGGKGGASAQELDAVQAMLPGLLRDLAARSSILSYQQLSQVVTSLRGVLPALRIPPTSTAVATLAAALPDAAANTRPAPRPGALLHSFGAVQDLFLAGSPAGGEGLPPALQQRLVAYLRQAVVSGPGCAERLRREAAMGELAAAVTLAVRFRLPQPREWVAAVAGRVDELIAAACPAAPPGEADAAGSAAKASKPGAAAAGATAAAPGGEPAAPGPGAASGGSKAKPKAAKASGSSTPASDTDPAKPGSAPPAGSDGSGGLGSSGGAGGAKPRPLEVRTLVSLLVRWSAAPPLPPSQQQLPDSAEKDQPLDSYWVKWLCGAAEAVWRTQDPAVQEQRERLQREVESLQQQQQLAAQTQHQQQQHQKQQQQEPQGEQQQQQQQRSQKQRSGEGSAGTGKGRSGGAAAAGGGQGNRRGSEGPSTPRGGADPRPEPDRKPGADATTNSSGGGGGTVGDTAAGVTAADLDRAVRELGTLGPLPESGPAARVETRALVEMAVAVGRVAGARASRRCCKLAEGVLRSRLGDMAASPRLVVAALGALGYMRHNPTREFVASALQTLLPALKDISPEDALELLAALEAFGHGPPRSPRPEDILAPLTARVAAAAAGSGGFPPRLVGSLLRRCAAWGVAVPDEALATIARATERRVRQEAVADTDVWALLSASERFLARTATAPLPAASTSSSRLPHHQQPYDVLGDLLDGVVLPLAQLGQAFPDPEMFMVGLAVWRAGGFDGYSASKATALLRVVGSRDDWYHTPQMRRDLERLLEVSLGAEATQALGPEELSQLLVWAAGAMAVMARKVERPGGIAAKAAPGAAPLLLPALERLLSLRPHAEQLAAVAYGFFVQLQWAAAGNGSSGGAGSATGSSGNSGDSDGSTGGITSAQRLLAKLLDHAEPSLEAPSLSSSSSSSGAPPCSARACALLLEACTCCGHTPPPAQRTKLYTAALRALQAREADAAVLISLAASIAKVESDVGPGSAEGDFASSASSSPDLSAAREGLLCGLAGGLTGGKALAQLSRQPGTLVDSVWRIALLGPRLPGNWVASYAQLVLSLMPEIKAKDSLAHAAAGLALMRAEPKASWLDTLWTCAESLVRVRTSAASAASLNWQGYGSYDLGLLLGAAHALRGGGGGGDGGGGSGGSSGGRGRAGASGAVAVAAPASPLSTGAQAAWSRAHATFVRDSLGVLPRYRPGELQLVVAAVADFELTRPLVGAAGGGGGDKGKVAKGPAMMAAGKGKSAAGGGGSGGRAKQAQLAATDFMGRVEPEWLEACGAALLESRKRLGLLPAAVMEPAPPPAAAMAFLPLPGLLLTLLRLASRVAAGNADGTVSRLTGAATQEPSAAAHAEKLLEYVKLSLVDWAAAAAAAGAGGEQGAGTDAEAGGGGPGTGLTVADWTEVLGALLDAGVQPPPAALEVYCRALFGSLADAASLLDGQAPSSSSAALWRDVWSAAESGVGGVLLRSLPWAPPAEALGGLRAGFLRRAPLEAASLRQLGLLATYCVQADAATDGELWQRLRAEVQRRVGQQQQQQASGAAASGQAARGGKRSSAPKDAAEEWAEVGFVASADLAAVCYALGTNDCGAGQAAAQWYTELEAQESGRRPPDPWFGECPALRALSALHRLYLWDHAHEALGHGRHGSGTAVSSPPALTTAQQLAWKELLSRPALGILTYKQLQQLLGLYLRMPWIKAPESLVLMQPDFASALMSRIADGPTQFSPAAVPRVAASAGSVIDPELAAKALVACLSSLTDAHAAMRHSSRLPLHDEPFLVCLAEAAEAGLATMPLMRAVLLLETLKDCSGWQLQQASLDVVVKRLLAARIVPGGTEETKAALDAFLRGERPCDEATVLPSSLLWKVAGALVVLAPQTAPGEPEGPQLAAAALATLTPLLQRLMPGAEERLWALALPARLVRGVKATSVAAAANAYLQFGPCAGMGLMLVSARAAADTVGAAVAALLAELQPRLLPAAPPAEPVVAVAATSAVPEESLAAADAAKTGLLLGTVDDVADLVSVLIAAGGPQELPKPLAAVVLCLLSCEGVIEAVPAGLLQKALSQSLTGHPEELPMLDKVAGALVSRLERMGVTSPVRMARMLRSCGASRVASLVILQTRLSQSDVMDMSVREAAALLQELYEAGVRERAADWVGRHEGFYFLIFEDAVRVLARHNLLSSKNVAAAGDALHYARLLAPRLNGSDLWALRFTMWTRPIGYEENLAPSFPDEEGYLKSPDRKHVWRYLDHLASIGPVAATEAALHYTLALALSREQQSGSGTAGGCGGSFVDANGGAVGPFVVPSGTSIGIGLPPAAAEQEPSEERTPAAGSAAGDSAESGSDGQAVAPLGSGNGEAAAGQHAGRRGFRGAIGYLDSMSFALVTEAAIAAARYSPYMLDGAEVAGIVLGLDPEIAASRRGEVPAPAARQLGLVYGLTALRTRRVDGRGFSRCAFISQQEVWPLYLSSLEELAARTDLPPLQHLEAMLGALEPALCVDLGGITLTDEYKSETLPLLMEPLAEVLAGVLDADEPPLPDGVSAAADESVLLGPRLVSEEALTEDLFWPPGTQGRLPLPTQLRPPPGRRHGFGDPAGDAAREAYVRQVAPWYAAARRLQAAAFPALLEGVVDLRQLLAERRLTRPGGGRWAQLLWRAVAAERLRGSVVAEARETLHKHSRQGEASELSKALSLPEATMLDIASSDDPGMAFKSLLQLVQAAKAEKQAAGPEGTDASAEIEGVEESGKTESAGMPATAPTAFAAAVAAALEARTRRRGFK